MKKLFIAAMIGVFAMTGVATAHPKTKTVTVCSPYKQHGTDYRYNWDTERWAHCKEVQKPVPHTHKPKHKPNKPDTNIDNSHVLPFFIFLWILDQQNNK